MNNVVVVFRFLLLNRIVRNVLFWSLLGLASVVNTGFIIKEVTYWDRVFLFFVAFIAYGPVVYFNNIFLLPRFFLKQKYWPYFGGLSIALIISAFYTRYIEFQVIRRIPQIAEDTQFQDLPVFTFLIVNVLAVVGFSMAKIAINWYINSQFLERLQKQNIESELKGLKAQIQPHFLFNSLNTIYGLVRKKDKETADIVLKLSEILRYVLYDSSEEEVPLERELEYLQNYIGFIKLRTRKDSDIDLNTKGNANGQLIAPLLLIPFVENCFKHGLDMHIAQPWVRITVKIEESLISFNCSNSNYNRDKEKTSKDSGIGLTNAKRRLELLYPEKHELSINDDISQFEVNLKIQLN